MRLVLLFGPTGHTLRDAVRRHGPLLGRATGRWIVIHLVGDPGFSDKHADDDRELCGFSLRDYRDEWFEAVHRYGGVREAETWEEDEGTSMWSVSYAELPCFVVFRLHGPEPPERIHLDESWWKGEEDRFVQHITDACSEARLLAHIEAQGWDDLGPLQSESLVSFLAESLIHPDVKRTPSGAAGPPIVETDSINLPESERRTPALDRRNGEWVRSREAARLEALSARTLATYRGKGRKSVDGSFGVDRDGRTWRKEGTPHSHPWYLRCSLKSSSKR